MTEVIWARRARPIVAAPTLEMTMQFRPTGRTLGLTTVFAVAALALAAQAAPMFSSAERAKGLLEGRGMGMATPAENNGYPGPRHVLDAADTLKLDPAQKAETQKLFEAMRAEAIPASKQLLADEAALDQLFIDRKADMASITAASERAAMSESAVRVIHLKYHLAMVKILRPDQIKAYGALGSHPEGAASTGHDHSGMAGMPGMAPDPK